MKFGVLDHDSALQGYTGPGTTRANDMNFVMNHAPGAWSIFNLLTSIPARYHCTTEAPLIVLMYHYQSNYYRDRSTENTLYTLSLQSQNGLTIRHFHNQLDPFVSQLTIYRPTIFGYLSLQPLITLWGKVKSASNVGYSDSIVSV